jgi:hypothetical protein
MVPIIRVAASACGSGLPKLSSTRLPRRTAADHDAGHLCGCLDMP